MTLARAILNATRRAEAIRRGARTHQDVEDAAAIEHLVVIAKQHLTPEASKDIAEALLRAAENPAEQTAEWSKKKGQKQ